METSGLQDTCNMFACCASIHDMTMTIAIRGAPMTDLSAAIEAQLDAAVPARSDDPEQVLVALDQLTSLIGALDRGRSRATDRAKELTRAALRGGVDYRDLYGRPLSHPVVRQIATEEGIVPTKRRPLRRHTA